MYSCTIYIIGQYDPYPIKIELVFEKCLNFKIETLQKSQDRHSLVFSFNFNNKNTKKSYSLIRPNPSWLGRINDFFTFELLTLIYLFLWEAKFLELQQVFFRYSNELPDWPIPLGRFSENSLWKIHIFLGFVACR